MVIASNHALVILTMYLEECTKQIEIPVSCLVLIVYAYVCCNCSFVFPLAIYNYCSLDYVLPLSLLIAVIVGKFSVYAFPQATSDCFSSVPGNTDLP